MLIDLREIPVFWINLDSATRNAERMNRLFQRLGFKNTIRKSAREIPAPPETPPANRHYVGCAQSHIDILDLPDLKTPFLILEDDAEVTPDFCPVLEVPNEAEALYLGISTGSSNYRCQQVTPFYRRIAGILATHAIMYLSDRYRHELSAAAKDIVYTKHIPFDVGCALLQQSHVVLTPNRPMFYQTDAAESANKWEELTRRELPLRE